MRTRTTLLAITVLSFCQVLAASTASADGWYFSEGFGTSKVGGELGEHVEGTANVRISLGRRFNKFAVEGFFMVNMLEGRDDGSFAFHEMTGFGISGRYMFPVGRSLELYLRAGLQSQILSVDTGTFETVDMGGRGLHYGAGAQVKKKVPVLGLLFFPLFFTDIGPKMTGSLWLETNHQITRLHHPSYASMDASITSWTFGFGMGSDF